MRRLLFLMLAISLVLAACSAKQSPASLTGSWTLTSYGPSGSPAPAVSGAPAQLTFGEDGTVTGNGGCNQLGGTYTVKGSQITFGDIVSTLMACDEERMAQEQAVTKVLSGTADYTIDGNTLTLTNQGTVLVLNKASYP